MKINDACGKAQGMATGITSLLCLVTVCSICLPAAGQDSNGLNSAQPPPSIADDLSRFSRGPVQIGPAVGPSWTSLGTYNFQNQTLSPAWRPPANNDLLTPAQVSALAPIDQRPTVPSEGSPNFSPSNQNTAGMAGNSLPGATTPTLPADTSFSKAILPSGSLIPVPTGIWFPPNTPTTTAELPPVTPSNGWLSYVCEGERGAGDTAKVVGALKALGVKSDALETLTDAVSSHSVLMIAAVAAGTAGYEFYRYNCP